MTPCEAEEKMIIVLGGTVGNSEEAVAHGLGFGCFRMMLMMTKKMETLSHLTHATGYSLMNF